MATAMKTSLLCVGFLLVSTVLTVLAGNRMADLDRSIGSKTNLVVMWRGLNDYAENHGTFPSSLDELVRDRGLPVWTLVSPSERALWRVARSDQTVRSSYVYKPGRGRPASNPDIIIAHDREPFGTWEPRIFAAKGRLVLFADGRVEHLKAAEFDEALRKDEQRRRELGWSTTNAPATSPRGN